LKSEWVLLAVLALLGALLCITGCKGTGKSKESDQASMKALMAKKGGLETGPGKAGVGTGAAKVGGGTGAAKGGP